MKIFNMEILDEYFLTWKFSKLRYTTTAKTRCGKGLVNIALLHLAVQEYFANMTSQIHYHLVALNVWD